MDVDAIPIRTANTNMVPSLGGSMSPQSSPLISIPIEVLLHINSHLTTPEYCNLRLTCKHIEDQLLDAFTKEFFQKKQFMFTEFSLQALVDISKSRFSFSLKHVVFGLEQPSTSLRLWQAPSPGSNSDFAKQNSILLEWSNHAIFINTGQHVEMLSEAFSALPNLDTIGLRDFNSRSRWRDFPNVYWNSYGAVRLATEIGSEIHDGRNDQSISYGLLPPRVFQDILRGAGKASLTLKNYEVILRHSTLEDKAFSLPPYLDTALGPVLANLRTIFLDLTSLGQKVMVENKGVFDTCPSYHLMKFLSRTVNLEHLRLNFRSYGVTDSLMSWLSRSPPTQPPTPLPPSLCPQPPPIALSRLRQLDIGMATLSPSTLLPLIKKHASTLRTISLHKISLLHPPNVPADERTNLWASLFSSLSKLNLKLDAINMSFLSQRMPGDPHLRHVSFKGSKRGQFHTKNWAGSDTASGLRDYEAMVCVDGLEKDTDVESEGSGSGSVDDEDEDSMDDLDHEDDEDEDDEDDHDDEG